MTITPSPFVTTSWLETHLYDANLRIVDGSWYLPQMARDADAEYLEQHIPGAVRFNPDDIADTTTDLPHMLANPEAFAAAMGGLGVADTDTIIVYDGVGLFSAARVWWNFKVMGVQKIFVLSGGMPKWLEEKRTTSAHTEKPDTVTFNAVLRDGLAWSAKDVLGIVRSLNTSDVQIVDLRSEGRFLGEAPEPRPGLRQGHIPGSKNLPFTDLITGGQMISPKALEHRLLDAGIDPMQPIVTTCGSGITAPILNLALASIGVDALQVYDGSWAEWGADEKLPVHNPSEK